MDNGLTLNVPASAESEMALLGSVMIDPYLFADLDGKTIEPTDFYLLKHQSVWEAMRAAYGKFQTFDWLIVSDELNAAKCLELVGGIAYLSQLINSTPSSANAGYYAYIVQTASERRRMADAARRLQAAALDESIDFNTVLTQATALLKTGLRTSGGNAEGVHIKVGLQEQWDEIERVAEGEVVSPRIPCRLNSMQDILGGYVPGAVYTIASRPGVGKSTLVHNELHHLATVLGGRRVLMYSYEMRGREVVNTVVSSDAGIPFNRVESRRIVGGDTKLYDRYIKAVGTLSKQEVYINDSLPFWEDARDHILMLARRGMVGAVAFDYLKLIRTREAFRGESAIRQKLSYLTREMKLLAMETAAMGCPVIVFNITQVSRAGSEEPTLEHLKDSGTIEEDSDAVVFLHRKMDMQGEKPVVEKTKMIVAKNRHGATGWRNIGFFGTRKSYEEFTEGGV